MRALHKKETHTQTIDMLNGPLAGKLLRFTIPIMLSGILQLLFNAADMIVVGRFAGSNALAAVGSNGALINLLINLLVGLSVGSSVTVAFFYGASQMKQVKETIETSVAISIIGGIICTIAGILLSPILLRSMGTPESIIDLASVYLKILFIGMPVSALFNFGSAILRSLGDTRTPLIYLSISGVVNVMLNLFFVIVLHLDVAGVALATIISEALSAFLTVRCLTGLPENIRLELRRIRVSRSKLLRILKIGLPAGIQSTIFSLSNVLIQTSVNSFGAVAVAGNSAASNIEGFIYVSMDSFYHTAQTFTSQNVGGRKLERVNKVLAECLIMVTVTGAALGAAAISLGKPLLNIYLPGNPEAITYGISRMHVVAATYFLCGLMEIFSGCIRGMGESLLPMIVSLVGSCLFRILWIATVFAADRTLTALYLTYPISWILTTSVHVYCYFFVKKRLTKKLMHA